MDSLAGKLSGLKSAWSEFSNMMIDSGIVGFFIDFGKAVLGVGESIAWFVGKTAEGAMQLGKDVEKLLGIDKLYKDSEEAVESYGEGVEGLKDKTNELRPVTEAQAEALKAQAEALEETNEKFADYGNLIESVNTAYKTATSDLDSLTSIQEEYNEAGALSNQNMITLASMYPELLGLITDETAFREALIEKIDQQKERQKLAFVQTALMADEYFGQMVEKYQIDLTNYKNMEQAKADITFKLINELNTAWSDYFRTLGETIDGFNAQTQVEDVTSEQWAQMSGIERAQYENLRSKTSAKKKEIASLGNAIDNLGAKFDKSSTKFSNYSDNLNKAKGSSKGASKGVDKLAKEAEKATDRFEKFAEAVHDVNKSLNALNRESVEMVKNLEQLESGDFSPFEMDKEKTLEELRPLIESHRKEMAKLYGDLETLKKVNTGKLTEEEKKMYDKQIELLKENIKEQESIQKGYAKNLESIRKQMDEDYREARDNFVKGEKEKFEKANEEAKKFQESEQDRIKNQKEALKDLQDFVVDMIKEEKDAEVDALNERIDAIDELVDAKKKALRQEQDARDYQKGLKKKEKDIADVEKRIAELQFDTSAKGIKERLELESQLAESKEALEDYQYENSIKKQEEALDEQASIEKKKLEAQLNKIKEYLSKEGQIRDDANKLIQNNSEDLYDRLSQYNKDYVGMTETELKKLYDTAISGLEEWGGAQESVNDAFDNMATAIDKVVEKLKELSEIKWTEEMGQNASDKYDKDHGYTEDDKGNIKPSGDKEKDREEQKRIIKQMQTNSAKWASASPEERQRLAKENESLAKRIGAWKSQKDGMWYVNINGKPYNINDGSAYEVRHDGIESKYGAFVGGDRPMLKSNETFLKAFNGELVATPDQMDNFMREVLPKLMTTGAEYITSNSSSPSLVLNVNGNVDSSVMPQLKTTMENGIRQLTQHMKNNGYRVNAKSYGI